MQSPSFLVHQPQFEAGQAQSNAITLFGIARIPSDNHIRDMLDPALPTLLHPVFATAIEQLRHRSTATSTWSAGSTDAC